MSDRTYNVLFLCRRNSARSILAEAMLNHHAHGRFKAFSAGSQPAQWVHPLALDTLARSRISAAGLRPKGWDAFTGDGAPEMDLVISVCNDAEGETCPALPGTPITASWGIPDPVGVGDERRAFQVAAQMIERLVAYLVDLPSDKVDALTMGRLVRAGRTLAHAPE